MLQIMDLGHHVFAILDSTLELEEYALLALLDVQLVLLPLHANLVILHLVLIDFQLLKVVFVLLVFMKFLDKLYAKLALLIA